MDIGVFTSLKNSYAGADAIAHLVLVTVTRVEEHNRILNIRTSLLATALLNSSRLWITTTLQRDTSKSNLTAQQEATLAHCKNPSIHGPSLETCYALNVSRSKLSSDQAFPTSL